VHIDVRKDWTDDVSLCKAEDYAKNVLFFLIN